MAIEKIIEAKWAIDAAIRQATQTERHYGGRRLGLDQGTGGGANTGSKDTAGQSRPRHKIDSGPEGGVP
jgi:hypothetical protein